MDSLSRGCIQTVCGPVKPDLLGITLTHEHLYHKANASMFSPRTPDAKYSYLSQAPFDSENLWWINFHPYSHVDNLRFDDMITEDAVSREMTFFKENGGSCIVEVTTFGKNLNYMQRLSKDSKVHIVTGTGFYVHVSQSSQMHDMKVEDIAKVMIDDLTIGENGIKCGVIGEIGTCYPIHPFERKVLLAAATVQEKLSVPVTIHPGRNKEAPFETMRIFLEAGGKAEKTVMCHLERTIYDDEELLEFAKLGCFCEFDLFGIETSYYELSDSIDMPSDAQRINRLKRLIDEGYDKKIVISHDIHTKHRLMKFGGHGYSHILLNTVPKMLMRGYTPKNVEDILINNPKEWLTL
ncbi:phosphotriesterase-related protein-like protein [Dinothrombium tinctorium]|uniref:Phosphotriesterase-related protein n=1 Tax=Dinothrombium tinctorium TaxID=1965070 RepID=A0A3S3SQC6_9ACAR|nr:phosphotriesterase-related protein-like protein [Dinothrombium tinctorium]